LLITFIQYAQLLEHPSYLANLTANLGMTRYATERILYLIPIIWVALLFGGKAGIGVACVALVSMLPRDVLISDSPEDALAETAVIFVIGNLSAFAIGSLRRERERRAELEEAHRELQENLRVIEESRKRLAALNKTSSIISQSLELSQVLDSAVKCVMNVMGADIVRIYTLDETSGELLLAAYEGVSERFVKTVGRIKIGEGFNGAVAESGKPLYVEDAFEDPRLTRAAVREENIHSQLIVPLISKGKVVGTLAVAMRSYRQFEPAEVDLLTTIGNQIGVAVENARLYQEEREVGGQLRKVADELRTSEQRYRELFENAHDAIWLVDLEGRIIAANRASTRLTGYSPEELHNQRAEMLLSAESIEVAKEMEHGLLTGGQSGAMGELKLVKKDGSEAIVQLASTLVFSDGQPAAFQHIARDVTAERRMKENLQFFLQHVTKGEEEERKRIARELHDETIQALVALCQQIDGLASGGKGLPRDARRRLAELHRRANDIMQGVRRLTQDLRPATLDNLGLVPALEWLAAEVARYSGVETRVEVIGQKRRLPPETELVIFRVTQEALRNVVKHARASQAVIKLEFGEDKTQVSITDNGTGFDPPMVINDLPRQGKLGLAGMQERMRLVGGSLKIDSRCPGGTIVSIELPS